MEFVGFERKQNDPMKRSDKNKTAHRQTLRLSPPFSVIHNLVLKIQKERTSDEGLFCMNSKFLIEGFVVCWLDVSNMLQWQDPVCFRLRCKVTFLDSTIRRGVFSDFVFFSVDQDSHLNPFSVVLRLLRLAHGVPV